MTGIAGLPVEEGILVTAPMTGIAGLPVEEGILVTASNSIREGYRP